MKTLRQSKFNNEIWYFNFDKRKQTSKMPLCDPQRPEHMFWYVVNWCCDVSIFKKLRFHQSTQQPTWKRCFQKDPLWRAFSKSNVISDRKKRRLRVDANLKWIKKDAFSKISGYVWMGPYIHFCTNSVPDKIYGNTILQTNIIYFTVAQWHWGSQKFWA